MEIKPYSKNAKKHPKKQIEQIAASIKEFGFNQPIVVDKQGVIIVGHGRYEALKSLGMEVKDEYIKVVDLTEEQAKSYRLADNKLNESDWDMDLVIEELRGLSEPMLDLTGFDRDLVIEPDEKDDEVPEIPEEPQSKLGDLYELGNHRVLCGDSTKLEDVERLMDGKKADMVFTDPPYGMKKENEGVLNDNLNFDALLDFNREWVALSIAFLKDNGSWYSWGIDEPLMDMYSAIWKPICKENRATFRNLITWDKTTGQGQNSDLHRMYATADEKCLFMMMGKQETNQNKDEFPEEWRGLLSFFVEERNKMGWTTKDVQSIVGVTTASHWFTESQFTIPTEKQYQILQKEAAGKAFTRPYDDLEKASNSVMQEFYANRAYFNNTHDNMNNVWHFERTSQAERVGTGQHATPKPLALCSRALISSSKDGELTLDLFLGSGSTLIAAEKTGRICYGMELDPKYVDVIVQRYVDYTGNATIVKNGEPIVWQTSAN